MSRLPALNVTRHPGKAARQLAYYEADAKKFAYLATTVEDPLASDSLLVRAADYEARAQALREEFAKVGRCRRCGKSLTLASSVDRSLGADCARKVGAA